MGAFALWAYIRGDFALRASVRRLRYVKGLITGGLCPGYVCCRS